jgi:ATP-binding cassette subfamily B (MDR/TAP) protein 1
MMFGMYSLIIWFGGQEISSGRATFDQMLKALFAVLFAAMGLAQVRAGLGFA